MSEREDQYTEGMVDEIGLIEDAVGGFIKEVTNLDRVVASPSDMVFAEMTNRSRDHTLRLPLASYYQSGDILPDWARYQYHYHRRGQRGELRNGNKDVSYITGVPVNLPFEIGLFAKSERTIKIWVAAFVRRFWFQPRVWISNKVIRDEYMATFELVGTSRQSKVNPSDSSNYHSVLINLNVQAFFKEEVLYKTVLTTRTESWEETEAGGESNRFLEEHEDSSES